MKTLMITKLLLVLTILSIGSLFYSLTPKKEPSISATLAALESTETAPQTGGEPGMNTTLVSSHLMIDFSVW